MVVDIPDVVTYTNFGDHRLRGFWVAGGQISPSPIDFHRRPYNTLALPCERVKRKQSAERGHIVSPSTERCRAAALKFITFLPDLERSSASAMLTRPSTLRPFHPLRSVESLCNIRAAYSDFVPGPLSFDVLLTFGESWLSASGSNRFIPEKQKVGSK